MMIRLVAIAGVFLNCLPLLAAEKRQIDADSVTWENALTGDDPENRE